MCGAVNHSHVCYGSQGICLILQVMYPEAQKLALTYDPLSWFHPAKLPSR